MANNSSRKFVLNCDQFNEIKSQADLFNNIRNIINRIQHHNHPCFPHVGCSSRSAIKYWKPKLIAAALSGEH